MTLRLRILSFILLVFTCSVRSAGSAALDPRAMSPRKIPLAPTGAVVTCDLDRYAINTTSISDGAGGTFVTWVGSNGLFAQRLDASGHPLWDPNGVPVSPTSGDKYSPMMVADGAGGVVIAWVDYRDWIRLGVFVQRLDANGAPLWATNGLAVRALGTQSMAGLVPDGAAGVIVAWGDGLDIYAQRVGAAGTLLWNANGVPVCTATGDQVAPACVSDGAGGMVVAWSDLRAVTASIYAQRLNGSGATQWALNGISIATLTGCPSDPAIVSDGSNGAIVTWADLNGSNTTVRAQAITALGVPKWTVNGVLVTSAFQHVVSVAAAGDGIGGVVVGWSDQVPGYANRVLSVQRLNSGGARLWGSSGVMVSNSYTDLRENSLFAGDGSGGAYIVSRPPGTTYDLLVQHVDAGGVLRWGGSAGLPVCVADGWRTSITTAFAGTDGVVVTWEDHRSGSDTDFYAQRFGSDGAALWTLNGTPVWVDPGVQVNPAGVPDGTGGMYLAWQQKVAGEYDIYLGRFNAGGQPVWPPIPVCAAAGSQLNPVVAQDGTGGLLVSWSDPRGTSNTFIQRLGPDGTPKWAPDGIEVPNTFGAYDFPCMVSDGAGGAILAGVTFCCGARAVRMDSTGIAVWDQWLSSGSDNKAMRTLMPDGSGGAIACWSSLVSGNADLYVQRISRDGVCAWGSYAVAVTQVPGLQWEPSVTNDGTGGAIVAWYDERSGGADVYAQRVDGTGVTRWAADGTPIAATIDYESTPELMADGAGGAFIAWVGGAGNDLIAQRIDSNGAARWPQPKVVCNAPNLQEIRSMVSDGNGGALLAWSDMRDQPVREVYAQRIDSAGSVQWAKQGLLAGVHADAVTQLVLVSDHLGGALLAWQDGLHAPRDTVELIHFPEPLVLSVGGTRALDLAITSVIPDPAAGPFSVGFVLRRAGAARIEMFGVDGRLVARRALDLEPGRHELRLDVGIGMPPGMYWLRLSQAGTSVTRRVCVLR